MAIDDKIRVEKSQSDINRAAPNVLPPQQHKLIEHAKFCIHLLERHSKSKERSLKSRGKNKLRPYSPWI